MKTVMITRTEPVFIEDEDHCSTDCPHYSPQIPRCVLFEVDIPVDEDDRRPRRVHACRTGEEERSRSRQIETLAETAEELSDMVEEASSMANSLYAALDKIR